MRIQKIPKLKLLLLLTSRTSSVLVWIQVEDLGLFTHVALPAKSYLTCDMNYTMNLISCNASFCSFIHFRSWTLHFPLSFFSLTQVLESVDSARLANMKGLAKWSSRFATNQTLSQCIKILKILKILSVTVFDFCGILPLKYWICVKVLFPLKEEEEKHKSLFLSSAELILLLLLERIQIIQYQIGCKKNWGTTKQILEMWSKYLALKNYV